MHLGQDTGISAPELDARLIRTILGPKGPSCRGAGSPKRGRNQSGHIPPAVSGPPRWGKRGPERLGPSGTNLGPEEGGGGVLGLAELGFLWGLDRKWQGVRRPLHLRPFAITSTTGIHTTDGDTSTTASQRRSGKSNRPVHKKRGESGDVGADAPGGGGGGMQVETARHAMQIDAVAPPHPLRCHGVSPRAPSAAPSAPGHTWHHARVHLCAVRFVHDRLAIGHWLHRPMALHLLHPLLIRGPPHHRVCVHRRPAPGPIDVPLELPGPALVELGLRGLRGPTDLMVPSPVFPREAAVGVPGKLRLGRSAPTPLLIPPPI